MRGRVRWIVYVVASKEDARAALDWTESLGPRSLHVSASGVIRAEIEDVPHALADVLHERRFADLRVGADSSVVLDLPDLGPHAVDTHGPAPTGDAVRLSRGVVLTDRQGLALARAVRAGYYDLPRRTDLQFLADAMGTSTSSLSELLRRAEGRLVRAYIADHPTDEATSGATEAAMPTFHPGAESRRLAVEEESPIPSRGRPKKVSTMDADGG